MTAEVEKDDYAIDWEETAYMLPPDDLMAGDCLRTYSITASNYKDYFECVREKHGLPPVVLNDLEKFTEKKENKKRKLVDYSDELPIVESTSEEDVTAAKLRKIKPIESRVENKTYIKNLEITAPKPNKAEKVIPSHITVNHTKTHDIKNAGTLTMPKNENIEGRPLLVGQNNSTLPAIKQILNSTTSENQCGILENDQSGAQPSTSDENNEMVTPVKPNDGLPTDLIKQQNVIKYNKKDLCGRNPITDMNCTVYHLLKPESKRSGVSVKRRKFYHMFINKKDRPEKEEKKLQNLINEISGEQKEYQQFLHQAALANMYEYLYLDTRIQQSAMEVAFKCVHKLIEENKKKFKMLTQFACQQGIAKDASATFLTFKRRVYEEGVIPNFELPPVWSGLPFDETAIGEQPERNCLSDDMIGTICKTEQPDVYMHSSVFLSIMETLAIDSRECLLPLEIREVKSTISGGETKKLLLFKEQFPRRIVSTREVNDQYLNRILRKLSKHTNGSTNQPKSDLDIPGEDLIIDTGDDEVTKDMLTNNNNQKINTKGSESNIKTNIHVNSFTLGLFQVLIETSVDQRDHESKTFQIFPKCEYQYVVGFEQFSLTELCRAFWGSHVANTDWIIFSRVDPRENLIRRNDTYARNILCPQACPYKPWVYSNHFHQLLLELKKHSVGHYVLERTANEPCFKLFEETHGEGFTLETAYQDILNRRQYIVDLSMPWLPVDTAIITDLMMDNYFIPALFGQFQSSQFKETRRANYNTNNANFSAGNNSNGGKGKKKGKKKGKNMGKNKLKEIPSLLDVFKRKR